MKEKTSLLEVIPSYANHVTTEWEENLSVITYPRFKNKWMRRFLLPKGMSPDIHVRLEEHGTAVWKLIDGKRTVSQIIELMGDHFDYEENYETRVTTFITQLRKDGFIKYHLPV